MILARRSHVNKYTNTAAHAHASIADLLKDTAVQLPRSKTDCIVDHELQHWEYINVKTERNELTGL